MTALAQCLHHGPYRAAYLTEDQEATRTCPVGILGFQTKLAVIMAGVELARAQL
jgi:hypothetical protein